MTDSQPPTAPGAFIQLIEYRTDNPDQLSIILDRWSTAIGARRTARWYVTAADRERPGVYLQVVEFPSEQAAAANSAHPATAQFATDLRAICSEDLTFRNLL